MASAARVLSAVFLAIGLSTQTANAAPAAKPKPASAARAPQPTKTAGQAGPEGWDEQRLALPLVGSALALVPHAPTRHVVIIVGDGGSFGGAALDIARHIAPRAVVIGLPVQSLTKRASKLSGCWYPAGDLELLAHAAERNLKLPEYRAPMLIGLGAGAGVVYAAVAGGPSNTFAGVISIGFTPSVRLGVGVCAGDHWTPTADKKKQVSTLPARKTLSTDWWVLNAGDGGFTAAQAQAFVAGVARAHVDTIQGPGSRMERTASWAEPLDRALVQLWAAKDAQPASAVARSESTREVEADLQRLQIPVELRMPAQPVAWFLFFSGDGGWASLDEETAERLVTHGVGVVGISSLRYFWTERQPAQVAADIRRLVAVLVRSGRPVYAGGYSFGAETVPVSLKEWNAADRQMLAGLVIIAPGASASFEIDPLDWVRRGPDNIQTLVAPAVRALGIRTLCLAGADDKESACGALANAPGVHVVRPAGSHHFNGDYGTVSDTIWQFIQSAGEKHP